jgi:hypothetical protein
MGCDLFVAKPNNATAFTSDQIVALAVKVEEAQAAGILSEEKGDYYIDILSQANSMLRGTLDTFKHIELCNESANKYQCIDSILISVQEILE